MLFCWDRVGDRMHFVATVLVAVGTLISAFWILAANSWMHTPAGHAIVDGRAVPVDWWAVIFNPSFPYRFAHMVAATYLSPGFAVDGMAAVALQPRPRAAGPPRRRATAACLTPPLCPGAGFLGN